MNRCYSILDCINTKDFIRAFNIMSFALDSLSILHKSHKTYQGGLSRESIVYNHDENKIKFMDWSRSAHVVEFDQRDIQTMIKTEGRFDWLKAAFTGLSQGRYVTCGTEEQ